MTVVEKYLQALQKEFGKGDATEHTHRPALKTLLESFAPKVQATNEPKAIERENKPDYIVRRGSSIVGFVEAKDIDGDLKATLKTPQLKRYLEALPNLILTNYLDFIWLVGGKEQMRISLGAIQSNHIKASSEADKNWQKFAQSFFNEVTATVTTPSQLAKGLAGQTRLLRDLVTELLETKDPDLQAQESTFKTLLVPDLKPEEFADMYAQTAAYGLFTARVFEHTTMFGGAVEAVPESMEGSDFSLEKAAYLIPKANPFLRQFFQHVASPDLNAQLRWLVEQIADSLRYADIDKVLHQQSKKQGFEDPVFHFYETFLAEYDKRLRESRGVYYTPEPVVDFIVRGVDYLLKEKFGRADGLADKNTLILDPAAGTATFLRKVIDIIHSHVKESGNAGSWPQYVHERLLPRVFGFELMMAPYTVAHLKLALQLQEQGFSFNAGERLHVYLTNTLDQLRNKTAALLGEWIARENEGAEKIKLIERVEVVLGNPPYSGISRNNSPWITELLKPYKTEPEGGPLKERKHWLNDDYVKFMRFAHDRINRTGHGMVAFITNNGWLDNPTFRGMRAQLMHDFDEIYIIDLHGSSKKQERTPEALRKQGDDKNVFDIEQGVGITFLIKLPESEVDTAFALTAPEPASKKSKAKKLEGGKVTLKAKIQHLDLWGSREYKYDWLQTHSMSDAPWQTLQPRMPYLLMSPRNESSIDEYEAGWKVTEILPINTSGIVTARDSLVLDLTKDALEKKIESFLDSKKSDEEIREQFFGKKASDKYPAGDTRGWQLISARTALKKADWKQSIVSCLSRPFDTRFLLYRKDMVDWGRWEVMKHLEGNKSIGLIAAKQSKDDWGTFVSESIGTHKVCVAYDINNFFPLWLLPEQPKPGISIAKQGRPNLSPAFLEDLSKALNKAVVEPFGLPKGVKPEDVLAYIYAVLHAPSYRSRYAQYLKSDFPRIPIAVVAGAIHDFETVWNSLLPLGRELIELHLLRKAPPKLRPRFDHQGSNEVEKPRYEAPRSQAAGKVWINAFQYFEGVEPEIWSFKVGGYQVCEKWLKDRKSQKLRLEDIEHYQNIVAALARTHALMTEIDVVANGALWQV